MNDGYWFKSFFFLLSKPLSVLHDLAAARKAWIGGRLKFVNKKEILGEWCFSQRFLDSTAMWHTEIFLLTRQLLWDSLKRCDWRFLTVSSLHLWVFFWNRHIPNFKNHFFLPSTSNYFFPAFYIYRPRHFRGTFGTPENAYSKY